MTHGDKKGLRNSMSLPGPSAYQWESSMEVSIFDGQMDFHLSGHSLRWPWTSWMFSLISHGNSCIPLIEQGS